MEEARNKAEPGAPRNSISRLPKKSELIWMHS
jgi:hypothetical protein